MKPAGPRRARSHGPVTSRSRQPSVHRSPPPRELGSPGSTDLDSSRAIQAPPVRRPLGRRLLWPLLASGLAIVALSLVATQVVFHDFVSALQEDRAFDVADALGAIAARDSEGDGLEAALRAHADHAPEVGIAFLG